MKRYNERLAKLGAPPVAVTQDQWWLKFEQECAEEHAEDALLLAGPPLPKGQRWVAPDASHFESDGYGYLHSLEDGLKRQQVGCIDFWKDAHEVFHKPPDQHQWDDLEIWAVSHAIAVPSRLANWRVQLGSTCGTDSWLALSLTRKKVYEIGEQIEIARREAKAAAKKAARSGKKDHKTRSANAKSV